MTSDVEQMADDIAAMDHCGLAEFLDRVAVKYEETAGEELCRHKNDVARQCQKISGVLGKAAVQLRKIK